jgi:hypothetical protein
MAISSPLQSKVPTGSTKTIRKLQTILLNRTKVKREIFQRQTILQNRRIENERRKQREDELEAPNLVTKPRGAAGLIAGSAKGFFERLVGFLSYLTAGWIINNLPTWISMGKEFIARTQQMGKILGNFVGNVTTVFTKFTTLLGASLQNLMTFDFSDTSGRVKTAFDDLNLSVENWGTDFENAIKLITTPLSEGIASGEDARPLGTENTNEGAYETSAPYSGEETTSGGKVVSPQAVYSYLKSKGMSHIHALGITANIKGESDFEIGVGEKGDSRSGVGLFQYSNVRKPAFLRAVPDYKTNWKGQIDYAINEDRAPQYLKMQFSSPEEAAYWWMNKWERPAARVYTGRNKKHNDFIKSFKPGSSQSQSPQQSSAQPSRPVSTGTTSLIPQTGAGGFLQGSSGKGMEDFPRYGVHFHLSPPNTSEDGLQKARNVAFLAIKAMFARGSTVYLSNIGKYVPSNASDSQIKSMILSEQKAHSKSGRTRGGIDIQEVNPNVGPTHKGLPGSKIAFPFAVGKVSSLSSGSGYGRESEVIGSGGVVLAHGASGSTASNVSGTSSRAQLASQSATPQTSSPTPAQITPTGTPQNPQISQSLAPERTGPTVIVSQNPSSPARQMMSSGGGGSSGGGSSPISEFTLLNNFIKNKLLLDLAYL